jgi:hypothetical protein
MEEPAASPGAPLAGGAPVPLYPAQPPPDLVELLHALDQYLFAARLAAEALRIQCTREPEEADATLQFLLLQLDAAADQVRAFLPRPPPR